MRVKNETQYKAALQRIDELLKVVSNETPADDKNFIELDLISDLVADYEDIHYPIKPLTLIETIELRMEEMVFTAHKKYPPPENSIFFRAADIVIFSV